MNKLNLHDMLRELEAEYCLTHPKPREFNFNAFKMANELGYDGLTDYIIKYAQKNGVEMPMWVKKWTEELVDDLCPACSEYQTHRVSSTCPEHRGSYV